MELRIQVVNLLFQGGRNFRRVSKRAVVSQGLWLNCLVFHMDVAQNTGSVCAFGQSLATMKLGSHEKHGEFGEESPGRNVSQRRIFITPTWKTTQGHTHGHTLLVSIEAQPQKSSLGSKT